MAETDMLNRASNARGPPRLPLGTGSALRVITENLSFHSSPESFIASRIAGFQQSQDPDILNRRTPIRAKILNRNVAVVSSYKQIKEVLDHHEIADAERGRAPAFVATDAYRQLMDQFFPPPNLLLADGDMHDSKRRAWDARMDGLRTCPAVGNASSVSEHGLPKQISDVLTHTFGTTSHPSNGSIPYEEPIDLYETMKTLSWRLLLQSFLGLSDLPNNSLEEHNLFAQMQSLHEDLLRGQFSLMPVSFSIGFWQTPRSTGIKSRKLLQSLIQERLRVMKERPNDHQCLANAEAGLSMEEIRDHVLMMTSSLAVKGLASLLTAFLLNLFLFENDGATLAEKMLSLTIDGSGNEAHRKQLESIYLETERLSPPIVGVMRRATKDVVIQSDGEEVDTIIPSGWDVWSYFVGGGRDPMAFGENCNSFQPGRYMDENIPEPLGFGAGSKSCLGKRLVREIALHIADYLLINHISLDGNISSPGLRAWLGWDKATTEQWAADLKQLPTQRPKDPVMVKFVKQD